MWELDCEKSWAPKNWCFWTVLLEKTLESSLDCKEIQPVHPKRNQSWIFIGRTDAEAPILWPPDSRNWLIGKDPDAGKTEGGRRRGWQRKRCLLLGRKTMTNLESILKSRDITLLTKVHSQSYGFPVVTYGCESWNIKKTEHWRIAASELWCCQRHLRVPWTARRSNQSILKEINPEYSSEGLMLKLQFFGHLMQKVDSLEKTLVLGKIEGRRRRGQ